MPETRCGVLAVHRDRAFKVLQRAACRLDELRKEFRDRPVPIAHAIELQVGPVPDITFLGQEKPRRFGVKNDAVAVRSGVVAPLIAVAPMTPMPGIVCSRRLASFLRCCAMILNRSDQRLRSLKLRRQHHEARVSLRRQAFILIARNDRQQFLEPCIPCAAFTSFAGIRRTV
jgi:hypothetical protein